MEYIDAEKLEDHVVIALKGHIDSANAEQVENEINTFRTGCEQLPVTINAQELEYSSSAGLRILLRLKKPTDIKILVTLSCTMCPDLVVAAQRIAAINPNVSAHIYDLHHFADLKDRHKVMSVPCMVVNDEKVSFGKKNLQQVLDFIREK